MDTGGKVEKNNRMEGRMSDRGYLATGYKGVMVGDSKVGSVNII